MPSYDPKRPRPGSAATDDVAPIDALLDAPATDPVGTDAAEPTDTDAVAELTDAAEPDAVVDEVDLREASPGQPPSSTPAREVVGSEVPVAPAPEGDTMNRAVLLAVVLVATAVAAVIAAIVRRRRRS